MSSRVELPNQQIEENLKQLDLSDSEQEDVDHDALTTMNAIMAYNQKLIEKLNELEKKKRNKLTTKNVKDTVKDTYEEVKSEWSEHTLPKHSSFELPIGNLLKSYGINPDFMSDDEDSTVNNNNEHIPEEEYQDLEGEIEDEEEVEEEETASKSGGGGGGTSFSLGNGDRDDIIVKVDATKTGITFCIHIPRN